MTKILFPSALLLCLVVQLQAQIPSNIVLQSMPGMERSICNDNSAGTFTFDVAGFIGQSNDVDLDPDNTIYLCLGDMLPIIHNGDSFFNGDPDPNTDPGIGYAFFDCPPTIDGPALQDILGDPCLNTVDPIIDGNGDPIPQDFGIWIARENINGDLTLNNSGFLQSAYNGGTPEPIQFWFAAITIDNFADGEYEGNNGGPCVNLNVADAFSVVYLNEIQANNITDGTTGNGCLGSFVVEGGLPEFDLTETYTIDITLSTDPTITGSGTFENTVEQNGSVFNFSVPQAGTYDITIEDGRSCGLTFQVDMGNCTEVILNVPTVDAQNGNTVCLDVTVENYDQIGIFQFTLDWDPAIISFSEITNIDPSLAGIGFNEDQVGNGILTGTWFDITFVGFSLPDGATLFTVCYDVIGNPGESSPVNFIDNPTPVEIGDPNANSVPFSINNGQVNVVESVLDVVITQDSVSCPGDSDGAFTITVDAGNAPYIVSWDNLDNVNPISGSDAIANAGGSLTVNGLPAGVYEITIEDNSTPNPEILVTSIEILAGPTIGVNIVGNQPLCFGENNGSVTAEVIIDGVVEPDPGGAFTFTWNESPDNVQTLSDVAAGFYAVTITAVDGGCTAEASTTLSQPPNLTLDASIVNARCSGLDDGELTASAAGGTSADGTYFFETEFGDGTVTAFVLGNITSGNYCVTVTDDNNCQETACFDVGNDINLSVNALVTDVNCNGICDGEIVATGITTPGGSESLPYTFTWNNVGDPPVDTDNSSTLTGLCAGTYMVTMTDSGTNPAGCVVIDSFEVIEPEALAIDVLTQTNDSCPPGSNTGSATMGVTGGTFPYTYEWSNTEPVVTDSVLLNIGAGNYTFLVTDDNSCMDSLEVFINAPQPPMILPIDNDTLVCADDNNGTLTAIATMGDSEIADFTWSNGAVGPANSNLGPGVYYVTVSDINGCFSVDSALVLAPEPLLVDSFTTVNPTCPGDNDGRIALFAEGGVEPYIYIWDNIPTPDTVLFNVYPGLVAGDYTYIVVDANGCASAPGTITLEDPPSILVDFSNPLPTDCFNDLPPDCNGSATATAFYSDTTTSLFTFIWSSGEGDVDVANSTANQLCRGMQFVTVTDENSCFGIDSIEIASPPAIEVTVDRQRISCNGLMDGSISVMVEGGTPDYNYLWLETGENTPDIDELAVGEYNVIITDANGCQRVERVPIDEPAELILSLDLDETNDVTCNGEADGAIGVFYNSDDFINQVGDNPFTWSDNVAPSSSDFAENLTAGTYSVTITDTKNCQDSITYTITEPTPVVAIIPQPPAPQCFGDQTVIQIDTVFGGNGAFIQDYIYEVDNNGFTLTADQTAFIFAGPHIVNVSDPLGCSVEIELEVSQPEEITVTFPSSVIEVELGDTTFRLEPIIVNTLPIDTFLWTPNTTLFPPDVQNPFVRTLESQEYSLTVTDINGCIGIGNVFIDIDKNRNVYIPNVFTPNGQGPGLNDDFRVFGCTGVEEITSARIFNRWGNLIFESTELIPDCEGGTKIWDGRFNDRTVNPGVYVYLIEVTFLDGISLLYRGDITVLR